MPSLQKMLLSYDSDLLNRIARLWGLDVDFKESDNKASFLSTWMVDESLLNEIITTLPEKAQKALQFITGNQGRVTWAVFSREYGDIRSFGPAKRERENPESNPASVAEILWYRGLIGRDFLDLPPEPQEYAFIPDEIIVKLRANPGKPRSLNIRPAVSQQPGIVAAADSSILDHLTDILAALRMGRPLPECAFTVWGIPSRFLSLILQDLDLINAQNQSKPEKIKAFFQSSRTENLYKVFQKWKEDRDINELRMLPGLKFEGAWQNDPLIPRNMLLDILKLMDGNTWWSISSLISAIKTDTPDFQRPAGDYDSWYIRDEKTNDYLRGFASWDAVEGLLIRFLISGPLHWLGILDLASGKQEETYTAFRLSHQGLGLLRNETPQIEEIDNEEMTIAGITTIDIPYRAPRSAHYQVARFCEFVCTTPGSTRYQITPVSLQTASDQGLNPHQLLQLLEKSVTKSIPTSTRQLISRWDEKGQEARVISAVLLRFIDQEVCDEFVRNPKTTRLVVERLNAETLLLRGAQTDLAQKLLAEMGILAQVELEV